MCMGRLGRTYNALGLLRFEVLIIIFLLVVVPGCLNGPYISAYSSLAGAAERVEPTCCLEVYHSIDILHT
jgi:hypothetical protein